MLIDLGPDKSSDLVELEQLGRERALIYKSYLLTGLRKSELASLTVGQLELDGPMALRRGWLRPRCGIRAST